MVVPRRNLTIVPNKNTSRKNKGVIRKEERMSGDWRGGERVRGFTVHGEIGKIANILFYVRK